MSQSIGVFVFIHLVSNITIDGIWDSNVTSIGSYAYAHTNLTEINMAMELLWRNNVNPQRVNLGLGFYGRSKSFLFFLHAPDCYVAEAYDGTYGLMYRLYHEESIVSHCRMPFQRPDRR